MWSQFKAEMDVWQSDGCMPDNECPIGGTGGLNWWRPPFFPLASASYWSPTFDASYFTNDWGGMSFSEIRDSARSLRINPGGWYSVLGDSAVANGKIIAPNWASWGGPYAGNNVGWDTEVGRATARLHGALLGELECYFAPGGYSSAGYSAANERTVNYVVADCKAVADSAVDMFIWPIIAGHIDSANGDGAGGGFTFARSRMNALGMMLDCLFPTKPLNGKSTIYRFGPHPRANGGGPDNQTLFDRSLSGIVASDTRVHWDDAFGKYFGVPLLTRDTSFKGTDGVGQTYTVHRVRFLNPNTNDTTFVAVGRYCRGTNRSLTATRVSVPALPSAGWYELIPGGTWRPHSGDTVYVANANWRFFARDTVLANTGVPGTQEQDTIPPSKTYDLQPMRGEVTKEIDLSWTAPGDDGQTGAASRYDIRYSKQEITESNWWSAASVSNPPVPLSAGLTQQHTIVVPEAGQSYYVALKAYDEANNASPLSNSPQGCSGGLPIPAYASTEINEQDSTALLSCSTFTSCVTPIGCEFQVDTDVDFTNPVSLVTQLVPGPITSVTFGPMSEGTDYYCRWRSRQLPSGETGPWAAGIRQFSLAGESNSIPSPPEIYSPLDADTVTSLTPMLRVTNGYDTDGDLLTYDFELYEPDRAQLISRIDDVTETPQITSWSVPGGSLENGRSYAWRSRCFDGLSSSPWTPFADFTVQLFRSGEGAEFNTHAFPNPFSMSQVPTVTFVEIPDGGTLLMMTSSRAHVRRWVNVWGGEVTWDGRNASGNTVAPGVYLWYVEGTDIHGKLVVVP
jgi:hypothetical protein